MKTKLSRTLSVARLLRLDRSRDDRRRPGHSRRGFRFMFNETVLWGNGSTTRGKTTMFGGSLSFQNKQVFSMQVTLFNGVMLKVVPGTKPKALSK